MGEGMDFSWLSSMFGGGGAGAGFGDSVGQPQLQGIFGGTPQQAGGQFMSGQAPEMVPFYGGGQNFQMPDMNFGQASQGGMGGMPPMGLMGLAGGAISNKDAQQQVPQMAMSGGGGGNTKGLFSALMRQPNLVRQAPATPTIFGGNLFG